MKKLLALGLVVAAANVYAGNGYPDPANHGAYRDTITHTGYISVDETWETEDLHLLDAYVVVRNGATLTIEAGTHVKGLPGWKYDAATLAVDSSSQIIAIGTAEDPIIFTAYQDGLLDPDDIGPGATGLWGGVVLFGNAPCENTTITRQMEGIKGPLYPWTWYGGADSSHSAGTMEYVSIRHGGTEIATAEEINGLTMCGLGSGTEISHVEVYANLDDGFEWFGGRPNCKYLSSAFVGDDNFDYDQGFRGKGQFWFCMSGATWRPSAVWGDKGGEHDGVGSPADPTHTLFSKPTICNVTYMGSGLDDGKTSSSALHMRDEAGGLYYNGIFMSFADKAVILEGDWGDADEDCAHKVANGDLKIENCIFDNFGAGSTWGTITGDLPWVGQYMQGILGTTNNVIADPGLISPMGHDMAKNSLDPRPGINSLAATKTPVNLGGWFSPVSYIGAFDPNDNWLEGWTAISDYDFILKANPRLICTPPTGHYAEKQFFEQAFLLHKPGVDLDPNPALSVVKLDGVDVTGPWFGVKIAGSLPRTGGKAWRTASMSGYLDAYRPKASVHTWYGKLRMDDGQDYTGRSVWYVNRHTEP